MKIGLVGYQGSGKSTMFEWLTGVEADPAMSHQAQSAQAVIPDPRIAQLVEIYNPKKITHAQLEIVDTPGLSRSHEGNAQRLALIREAGCLLVVVGGYSGGDPIADLASFDEDPMLADMEILGGRIEKVEQSLTKPVPRREREELEFELKTLTLVNDAIEAGSPIRESELSEPQQRVTRAFRLLSEKPRLVLVNTADDEEKPERFTSKSTDEIRVMAVPASLELELSKMEPDERAAFLEEMELTSTDRDHFITAILKASAQMIFFTAGETEVRSWLLREGGTAVEAAGNIHTDLARGFIRAETMTVADLVKHGSERELKAAGLARQESKDYVIQDDDVIFVKFSV